MNNKTFELIQKNMKTENKKNSQYKVEFEISTASLKLKKQIKSY